MKLDHVILERPNHILTKNKTSLNPKRILFYDSETNIKDINYTKHTIKDSKLMLEKHSLKLGYYEYFECVNEVYVLIEYGCYYTKKEFCDLIERLYKLKHQSFYVFAHNQSFDFRISVDFDLLNKPFELINNFVDGFRFIMIFRHRKWKRKLIFLDSMNYFRTSIEKLGIDLGIKKIQIDDFKTVDSETIYNRCLVDVQILRETIFKLIRFNIDNKCGKFCFTGASQSFTAFRQSYMKTEIFIHRNIIALETERKGYYGGRTECFKIGVVEKECKKLDINSMYPYEMSNHKYPTKLIRVYTEETGIDLNVFNDILISEKHLIIAELEIETFKNSIPLKDNENHRLIFPIGKFKTTLCEPEIKLLLENGGKICNVYKMNIYECDYIFKDYVKHFYNQRQKYKNSNDKIFEYFTKIFMNSLYGKFGQKSKQWLRSPEYDYMYELLNENWLEFIDKEDNLIRLKFIGGNAFKEDGYVEFYNGSVAISGFVTSYARCDLYRYMIISNIVYYVDTDSIFTDDVGYNNLLNAGIIDDKELGKLKIEDSGTLEIRTLKDYTFNGVSKIKGIKKGSVQIDDNKFEISRFTGFNEGLRYFDIDHVYSMKIQKTLKREYSKGTVLSDGIVKPFKLSVKI